jgi:hypothetical protein
MPTSYYDDDDSAEYDCDFNDYYDEFMEKNKRRKKKLNLNPNGPYKIRMSFNKTKWEIVMQNIDEDELKVTTIADKKIEPEMLESLKKYLFEEGFEDAAKEWNLHWKKQ